MDDKNSLFSRPEIAAAIITGAVGIVVAVVAIIPAQDAPETLPLPTQSFASDRELQADFTKVIHDAGYPEIDDSDNELIDLLDERARRTISELERIKEDEVKKTFIDLHNRNIKALRAKQPIVSRQLVADIRELLKPFDPPLNPNVIIDRIPPEQSIQDEVSVRRFIQAERKRKAQSITPAK